MQIQHQLLDYINTMILKYKLSSLYGTMYIKLDDYSPYKDSLSEIFEMNFNEKIMFCYGYKL